jgi:hypothetical protein
MDQVGGSVRKVQVAQVVISIARSIEDIDGSRATLAVLKNRSGKSGAVYHNIKYDNGTSTISCDEVETFDNTLIYQAKCDAASEENQRQMVRDMIAQQKMKNNSNNNTYSYDISPNKDF